MSHCRFFAVLVVQTIIFFNLDRETNRARAQRRAPGDADREQQLPQQHGAGWLSNGSRIYAGSATPAGPFPTLLPGKKRHCLNLHLGFLWRLVYMYQLRGDLRASTGTIRPLQPAENKMEPKKRNGILAIGAASFFLESSRSSALLFFCRISPGPPILHVCCTRALSARLLPPWV